MGTIKHWLNAGCDFALVLVIQWAFICYFSEPLATHLLCICELCLL